MGTHAQRVVLFPFQPLFNIEKKELSSKFVKALHRIFRIIDHDNEGRLSDDKLNHLQKIVFQNSLSEEDIIGIKDVIKEDNSEGLTLIHNHINLKGFITLQKKCIESLKF